MHCKSKMYSTTCYCLFCKKLTEGNECEENIPRILDESCIQLCILSCIGKSENALNQIHEDWIRVKKRGMFPL